MNLHVVRRFPGISFELKGQYGIIISKISEINPFRNIIHCVTVTVKQNMMDAVPAIT